MLLHTLCYSDIVGALKAVAEGDTSLILTVFCGFLITMIWFLYQIILKIRADNNKLHERLFESVNQEKQADVVAYARMEKALEANTEALKDSQKAITKVWTLLEAERRKNE